MNKGNKLLLGILTFIVVCVVGYALFSETITVTGTAAAQGNFDITATCTKGIAADTGLALSDIDGFEELTEGGYENDTCTVSDNKVSFNVNLKYPSAARMFTVKVENTGSIPAELIFGASEDGDGLADTVVKVCKINSDGSTGTCSSTLNWTGGTSNPFRAYLIGFRDKNGFYSLDNTDKLLNFFDVDTENIILDPGESVYYVMGMIWSESYKSDINSSNYKFEATTTLPFTQITN